MYSIYFNHRIISICNNTLTKQYNPNATVLHSPNNKTLMELPGLFEKAENIQMLYIPIHPNDLSETVMHLTSTLTPINAGGGLVQNEAGEYLLIHRNGLWDLPKGKQEEGEDIALTALREVEEECGISGLEQKELLCVTHHTYRMNGMFMLKHTYWYNMIYRGDCSTVVPQLEEGIQECKWVPASQLPELLKDTYPSIRKVFEEARLI